MCVKKTCYEHFYCVVHWFNLRTSLVSFFFLFYYFFLSFQIGFTSCASLKFIGQKKCYFELLFGAQLADHMHYTFFLA